MNACDPTEHVCVCLCGAIVPPDAEGCLQCALNRAERWDLPGKPIVIVMAAFAVGLAVAVGLMLDAAWQFYRTFH